MKKDIVDIFMEYIKRNPDFLNNEEKKELFHELPKYAENPNIPVTYNLIHFLEYAKIISSPEEDFLKYIISKYPKSKFPRVLEVATGRTCSFAQKLRQNGYMVTAMDPDIKIKIGDERAKGIKLLKRKFIPDFDISKYNIVVGFNACPAAGALLSVKSIPSVFTICDMPETDGKLDIGENIDSKQTFLQELIKRKGYVTQFGNLTIVDNSRVLEQNYEETR